MYTFLLVASIIAKLYLGISFITTSLVFYICHVYDKSVRNKKLQRIFNEVEVPAEVVDGGFSILDYADCFVPIKHFDLLLGSILMLLCKPETIEKIVKDNHHDKSNSD